MTHPANDSSTLSLPKVLLNLLHRKAAGKALLPVCFLVGLIGSMTAIIPGSAIFVPASVLNPRRWRSIAFSGSLGSSIGALLLILIIHSWGWSQIYSLFPNLLENDNWQHAVQWITDYGLIGLFLICCSPLPQTPALIFISASPLPLGLIFLAIISGKLLKYGGLSLLSSRFPHYLPYLQPNPPNDTPKP
jgi:membrane protein YqaA with SNARE-associated domain